MSMIRFVTDADDGMGECVGRIRTLQRPFYAQDKGVKFDPANDGIPTAPADRKVEGKAIVPAVGVPLADPASTKSAENELPLTPKEEPTTLITRPPKKK